MTIQEKFEHEGAIFLSSVEEIATKLNDIRCFIFDWDGVFNKGIKSNDNGSSFAEPDSMGLNMLRFSYWLRHGSLPLIVIVSGANNITALDFAKREHINAVYLNSKNKQEVIAQLTNKYEVAQHQSLFVFDDIIDLNVAKICSLSFCVRRSASILFNDFVIENKLCNYITAHGGGDYAVREITELIIGLYGNYNETISKRMEYKGPYEEYLSIRNSVAVNIQEIEPIKAK